MKITIIYRVCDGVEVCSAYNRCFTVGKRRIIHKCLDMIKTNVDRFRTDGGTVDFICVYDNCSDETLDLIHRSISGVRFVKPDIEGNAGSFCKCVSEALTIPPGEIVYFLEDDYLMLNDSVLKLMWFNMTRLSEYEGRHIAMMPDDYPDRYQNNTYVGTVRVTPTGHFIKINSTTCTFAAYSEDISAHREDLLKFINWPRLGEAESINKMWLDVPLYNPIPAWTLHSQTKAVMPIYLNFDAINEYFNKQGDNE